MNIGNNSGRIRSGVQALKSIRNQTLRFGYIGLYTTFAVLLWLGQPMADTIVVISRKDRTLRIECDQAIIKQYRCALGKGGVADSKQKEGDKRTPAGDYQIYEIRSNTKFHRFLHLSYPNQSDIENGYKAGLIDNKLRQELLHDVQTRGVCRQNSPLGGFIGIHGLHSGLAWVGRFHRLKNWTLGCIAVTNEEMDEIVSLVRVGTKVKIE